jgi:hypothetical protein
MNNGSEVDFAFGSFEAWDIFHISHDRDILPIVCPELYNIYHICDSVSRLRKYVAWYLDIQTILNKFRYSLAFDSRLAHTL